MERPETTVPRASARPADSAGSHPGEATEVDDPAASDREARLVAVLAAYLQAADSGLAPDREEWLAAHPDLAQDLAAFLREEDRLHRLVGPPPRAEAEPRPPEAPPADIPLLVDEGIDFGDHVLLETIARGGMGIVFRARHKSLGRLVALKMILGGDLATEEDRRRFRHEAGAIAQLDHPNIVPIYEAGEHRGHCYYAMKLIEGGGLDRTLGGPHGDPRGAARLMIDVARAVHHAHQRGILHRDLKPSNILIDGEGRPHVADFGLAKRLGIDAGEATRTGLVLGTPSYMAPEQAMARRDPVTTATDVYGLGAVLYALLTGRPPFRGESILETMELVRVREPDPPSSPGSAVDRDLQTICLTCLRKEPNRRYASAAALADDLERWLAGEPIAARPMRRAERLGRWARREPLSAGLVAAVVVLLVLGIAGLVASNRLIARERDEARNQRRIALERSRQARRAVDEMYTEVAERWLYDQPRLSEVQREFLEKALRFYEDLSEEDADDPAVQVDRARALGRVAWIRFRLGRPEPVKAALYRPTEILRALCRRSPDRLDYLEELGTAYSLLSSQLSEQKRWEEANRALENAVDAFRELVRRDPREPRYRPILAMNQAHLGLQYQSSGLMPEAQRLGFESVATLDAMGRDFPDRADPHDRGARMRVLEDLGCVLVGGRRFREAEDVLRESLALGRQLPEGTIARQDLLHRTGHTTLYLGQVLLESGRDEEARAVFEGTRDLFERLVRDYPDLPSYQVDLVDANLGTVAVLADLGRHASGLKLARGLVEQSGRLAADHPDLANCQRSLQASLLRLGQALASVGPPEDVERAYQRAVRVGERLAAIDPSGVYSRYHLAGSQLEMGEYLWAAGRREGARPWIDRSIRAMEELVGRRASVAAFRQTLARAHAARVGLLAAVGDREGARRDHRRASELFADVSAQVDRDPRFTCQFVRFLAGSPLEERRDPGRAVELARRAAERYPQHGGLSSALALACYRAGDWPRAVAAAEKAIRLENGDGPLNRLVLAMAHRRAGNDPESRRWYRAANQEPGSFPNDPTDLATLRKEAATLLGPALAGPKGASSAHQGANGP